ncbi:MAG: hypothetical protein GWO22_33875, partial [Actinobacteria bacterium]|nr:hypothetical protein [Actinomycetota bacterium]
VDLIDEAGLDPGEIDPAAAEGQDRLFGEGAPDGPEVRTALLTSNNAVVNFAPAGSCKRSDVVGWIGAGLVDLVIGTHALIQEGLHFDRLGIAVV